MLGSTITINDGASRVLVKINQDNYGGEYLLRLSDMEYRAKIRHSRSKNAETGQLYDRHNVEFTKRTFGDGVTPDSIAKFYFVTENLPAESTVTLADAVMDLGIASSNAFLVDVEGWQS